MKTPEAGASGDLALIAVGKIAKAHGVRGEVKVVPLTNVAGRFDALETVVLERADGVRIESEILSIRGSDDNIIVAFGGIGTREQADVFRGAYVSVKRDDMPPLDDNQFYTIDLIGMRVEDEQGSELGVVEDVVEYPASATLVIRSSGRTFEIPAVHDFIGKIDMSAGTVTVKASGIPDRQKPGDGR